MQSNLLCNISTSVCINKIILFYHLFLSLSYQVIWRPVTMSGNRHWYIPLKLTNTGRKKIKFVLFNMQYLHKIIMYAILLFHLYPVTILHFDFHNCTVHSVIVVSNTIECYYKERKYIYTIYTARIYSHSVLKLKSADFILHS